MATPMLFVLTRLIAALPSAVDPDMAAERCPIYCATFECDGSAWCLNGAMPAPCTGCPSFAQAAAFAVSPPRREITIPPYVGAISGIEAQAQCEKLGGHLASAANEAENKHLLSILVKYKRDRAIIGAQRTWLGGDEWRWQGTEQPLSYWNWAPNQPDNTYDQCSEMWTSGQWNDIKCEVWPSMAYLCDVAVPEPGFTFICSPGVQARLPCQGFGCHAKASTTKLCRYVIKTMSLEEKKELFWDTARDRCTALGGQLAEPRTKEQTQFLASAIRAHSAESLWIGLKRKGDGFSWEGDGSSLRDNEAFWSLTEPNGDGSGGDCVEMWEDGTWNDRSCDIGNFWSLDGRGGDCVEMSEDGTWHDRSCEIGKALACELPVAEMDS